MNQAVTCNNCREMFVVENNNISTMMDGNLEVQYFSCPKCGKKYLVLATDGEMRELIARYKKIAMRLRIAHKSKSRSATIRKYERELEAVKKSQMKKLPELKRLGQEVLERSCGNEPKQ